MVRVRFAPSPTGYLHIGGARTALFNWMYAKAQGGQFILRIEDTDKARSKPEYLDEILDSMRWLGLTWDDLYRQSDRFSVYQEQAEKLLSEGKAYKDGEAVILKMPQQEIKFFDLIRGEVKFDTSNFIKFTRDIIEEVGPEQFRLKEDAVLNPEGYKAVQDLPLLKSDGSPTYNFACVVDDAEMGISHVIRGEDHISNTPKQIIIYQALELKIPKFAHLPLILDPEGGRLSKRHGAVAVSEYRKMGFLPEAVVNYLMLLGWSPGDNQEKVDLPQAVKRFSIKRINKAGAAFSMDKLKWINGQYIKEMDDARLALLVTPFLKEKGWDTKAVGKDLASIVHLFKSRMSTLADFLDWAGFIFNDDVSYDEGARTEHLSKNRAVEFGLLADRLKAGADFNAATAEEAFRSLVKELGIEAGTLVHPVRVALTGRAVGPGLFDTMAVLGRARTIQRLRQTFTGDMK